MNIPVDLADSVREFMMATQSNLDAQQELETFLELLNPSLREDVVRHIFMSATQMNSVFNIIDEE